MRGEDLHEQDREDKQHINEVPCHHHGLVEVFIKARFDTDADTAVAGEVGVQFGEGQLRQEENHQADAEEAKPERAALVAGGGIHRRPHDGDEACYYGSHFQALVEKCTSWNKKK